MNPRSGQDGRRAERAGGRQSGRDERDEPAPLVDIERAALAAAKAERLDLHEPGSHEQLRALLRAAVEQWNLDHKHGLRPFALTNPEVIVERAFRNLAGYGPLEGLLADDDVWEIMINAPDEIFVERHRGVSGYHDEVFHDDEHVTRTLTKLLDDASGSHRKLDPSLGLQDAQLDDGARLHIIHRDIGAGGHLIVNIRRFTGVAFQSLDELVDRAMLSPRVAHFLVAAVQARLSIVFAGPPGSGKTTLLSCCAAELDPSLRVVTAEEVFELDVPLPNVASMQTRARRPDREEVDLRRLVSGFLRMAPDVAIVGEVRDREALPLLLTLSSGVKGYTTIHAGSARQALTRLRFVSQLADTGSQLPMRALNALVTDAVDLVVHCSRHRGVPRVNEVVAVEDRQAGPEASAFTVTDVFRRPHADDELAWSGAVPTRIQRPLALAGYDVRELVDARGGPPGPAGR